MRWEGLFGLTFQRHFHSGLSRLVPNPLVVLDACEEVFSALRVRDVLDADVDPLGDDLAAETFVDDHAQSVLCHVEHAPRLAVVELVRHAFLDGSVTLRNTATTNN